MLANAVETGRGQRFAAGSDAGGARYLAVPHERGAQGIEYRQGGSCDFRPDAVTGDEGCGDLFQVRHKVSISVCGAIRYCAGRPQCR